MPDEDLPPYLPPPIRWKPYAAGLAAVVAVVALWVGGARVAAGATPKERDAANERIKRLAALGEREAAAMTAPPLAGLRPLHEACSGKLAGKGGENAVLVYFAGASPEVRAAIKAEYDAQMRSRLDKSRAIYPDDPEADLLVGLDHDGDRITFQGTTRLEPYPVEDAWRKLVWSLPWSFHDDAVALGNVLPDTSAARYLAVASMREGMPPMVVEQDKLGGAFVGGTATWHVRVVDLEGAAACEGTIHVEVHAGRYPDTAFTVRAHAKAIQALCGYDGPAACNIAARDLDSGL